MPVMSNIEEEVADLFASEPDPHAEARREYVQNRALAQGRIVKEMRKVLPYRHALQITADMLRLVGLANLEANPDIAEGIPERATARLRALAVGSEDRMVRASPALRSALISACASARSSKNNEAVEGLIEAAAGVVRRHAPTK